MRAFVALEIPQAVRDEIARRIGRWKASTPPARWVRPEAWHVTLLFLGEVPEGQTEDLRSLLAPAFRRRRTFDLQVVGAGTFPPRRPARVAWLGLESRPADALGELRDAVVRALMADDSPAAARAAAEEGAERPFHGHLTLARCRKPWGRKAVKTFSEQAAEAVAEPFPVRRGVLFESRLGPEGARYREVASFSLSDDPAESRNDSTEGRTGQ
ncbi:MAG: RNA 2',3'-cyclic phosphodiesterase [Acidobacteriota bacterium]|nr:RNA 2',3'-cyclic phosphodiesterase [Acidobacteriota bacterium]